jgi:hypothetical protein
MERYLTLGKYSFITALPYLTPGLVEVLNGIGNYLGTLHTTDPMANIAIVAAGLAIGDAVRALVAKPKGPVIMEHHFLPPKAPDYRIIDATEIR